jgi:hypothetical protein
MTDAILGGDVYRFVVSGGPSQAIFSDMAIFSNLVKLFSANVSLVVSANTTVTLQVFVNGSLDYRGNGQSFNVLIPVTIPGHTYNITLAFNSSYPSRQLYGLVFQVLAYSVTMFLRCFSLLATQRFCSTILVR